MITSHRKKWKRRLKIGKEKEIIEGTVLSEEERKLFADNIEPKLEKAVFSGAGKEGIYNLKNEWMDLFHENFEEGKTQDADDYYEEAVNDLLHKEAIENDRRADGRGMDDVRELYAKAGGIAPMVHGTVVFYRGGTHVL